MDVDAIVSQSQSSMGDLRDLTNGSSSSFMYDQHQADNNASNYRDFSRLHDGRDSHPGGDLGMDSMSTASQMAQVVAAAAAAGYPYSIPQNPYFESSK